MMKRETFIALYNRPARVSVFDTMACVQRLRQLKMEHLRSMLFSSLLSIRVSASIYRI